MIYHLMELTQQQVYFFNYELQLCKQSKHLFNNLNFILKLELVLQNVNFFARSNKILSIPS